MASRPRIITPLLFSGAPFSANFRSAVCRIGIHASVPRCTRRPAGECRLDFRMMTSSSPPRLEHRAGVAPTSGISPPHRHASSPHLHQSCFCLSAGQALADIVTLTSPRFSHHHTSCLARVFVVESTVSSPKPLHPLNGSPEHAKSKHG
jgi:hypothetical protein